ncbi:hypothetical protein RI367_002266 [Sorochytrium milnesiophthora]
MSARKKSTIRQFLDDTPSPTASQVIARVVGPRGNNLHDVILPTAEQSQVLVELPPRFRNIIWVKRGHYVIVEPFAATATEQEPEVAKSAAPTHRIYGTIEHVIYPNAIKALRKSGAWPTAFDTTAAASKSVDEGASDEDDDLMPNTNRQTIAGSDSDGSGSESDS